MKYYIELQGTCWLVQYLNYINKEYDKGLFFKYLALNRFLRYKNAIKLVNNKELINTKEYLLESLLTFEGSLFDIEDILNYKINGDLKNDIKLEDIMLMNEKVLMFLLEMYDNNIDLSNKIFKELNKTFGNLKFEKNIKNTLNIVISNPKLECKKININKETYYKAFTGYQNDEYVLISNKYLKEFLNHMICDKITIKEETTLDFYKYMEE